MNARSPTHDRRLLLITAVAALGVSGAAWGADRPMQDCAATAYMLETGESIFNCGFRGQEAMPAQGAEGPIRSLDGSDPSRMGSRQGGEWTNDFVRNTYEQNALGGGAD